MTPTLYEVRSAAGTLYVPGIGAAVDAARLLSDEHDRAEVHGGGALVAVYIRGELAQRVTPADRIAAIWPGAGRLTRSRILCAAVARSEEHGIQHVAALYVEAVLARDAAGEES